MKPDEINWTPELLEECRNERGIVFCMLSEEAQDAMETLFPDIPGCLEFRQPDTGLWRKVIRPRETCNSCRGLTYRIRPDWTPPEKPKVKRIVECAVKLSSRKWLQFVHPVNGLCSVSQYGATDFRGYKFSNGEVRYDVWCSCMHDGFICTYPVKGCTWEHCTHVLIEAED